MSTFAFKNKRTVYKIRNENLEPSNLDINPRNNNYRIFTALKISTRVLFGIITIPKEKQLVMTRSDFGII